MFKYVLQIIVGIFTLFTSTLLAWYEGSALIDHSLEWKYSTPFTKMFNIEITNGRDISQLDYFVYAVKFQPLFPTIMMLSVLYILWVIGFYLIRSKSKWTIGYWGFIGVLMLILSGLIYYSSTLRDSMIFWITLVSGICQFSIATWVRNKQRLQLHIRKS